MIFWKKIEILSVVSPLGVLFKRSPLLLYSMRHENEKGKGIGGISTKKKARFRDRKKLDRAHPSGCLPHRDPFNLSGFSTARVFLSLSS
jgi:hypothetical protein